MPSGDFMLGGGAVHHVAFEVFGELLSLLGAAELHERTAVFAVGSNASPARLVEKCGSDAVVPVARISMPGWAAVYSAHMTRYGSVAATLHADPDSTTELAVTFLDELQLSQIDATEPNYDRIPIAVARPGWPETVTGYRSWRGPISLDDQPVRLAEVPATSKFTALDQLGMLDAVAELSSLADDGLSLSQAVAGDLVPRAEVIAWISEHAALHGGG